MPVAINVNLISNYFHRQTVIGDSRNDWASYSMFPSLSTTEPTKFGTGLVGCVVYGYPSTGGALVKEADLLDMLFLSLNRSHESQRSPSVDEEDRFYFGRLNLAMNMEKILVMREYGATFVEDVTQVEELRDS
ncbi:hypothetical protein PITC_037320 [Penicillium italicum]|uniref:Uncharacterized protein n=1 Tax=Penicillium italicum TaxID=40296 RepID=A0A0A2LAU7_PENIT|nr:hypothetical protein PITC_037320 [Penicillium italicum]